MEAKFGGKNCHVYGPVVSDMKGVEKKSLEWDLNDWKWDGDLFTASPLNPVSSDCRSRKLFPVEREIPESANLSNSSSSASDDINPGSEQGKREFEKRRRAAVGEDGKLNDEAGLLNLKLGGQIYPIMEGEAKSGKKTKTVGTPSNRAVCQVEDCRAELTNAKDYHRRHKVCDMHSKASKALVGNVMQRFCQQCSRFHLLQEFDEGKRSCRRRLAGHNRRRRKTHLDKVVNGSTLNDERGSSFLLITLLRILSNMHSNSPNHTNDQDLLSHLSRNLTTLAGTTNGRNIATLLEGSQGALEGGMSSRTEQNMPEVNINGTESSMPINDTLILPGLPKSESQCMTIPVHDMPQKCRLLDDTGTGSLQGGPSGSQPTNVLLLSDNIPSQLVVAPTMVRRTKLHNIDLNNVYDDTQDNMENPMKTHSHVCSKNGPLVHSLQMQCDSYKSTPPQPSGNSDSTSSSSSGEAQTRTDRIVFKLFGKDPNDFPLVLRSQILNWLSHSPTDMESYIRPGCIILTIYFCLDKSAWEELCYNFESRLKRLLDLPNDSFWSTGWMYARVLNSVVFVYNGQIVLDVPLLPKSSQRCRISSIKPIAVSMSGSAHFVVKGFNLSLSSTRLLCAFEGKYLVRENCFDLIDGTDINVEHDELQCLSFSCSIPNVIGRGFIEVEDHGLSSSFLPFIVAEKEICSEICMLEGIIEAAETVADVQRKIKLMEERTQALNFLHELGWLLHHSHAKLRLDPSTFNNGLFSFKRFKWLVEFSMDHDWCAVIKKLLDIIFEGTVNAGEHPSVELALLEMCLLHRAVKRNCRPMVELLLRFVPVKIFDDTDDKIKLRVDQISSKFLFKPDFAGPVGLTSLHIAASRTGSENVLDALTDDPGLVGIEAWKSARDDAGLTPNDYASLCGNYSYINLVQKKLEKKSENCHVVLDIPCDLVDCNKNQKQSDAHRPSKVLSLHTKNMNSKAMSSRCNMCQQKFAYGNASASLVYRPAMLSMVAIAAVCVCVALLFKSSPKVSYVFQPFTWESLKYGWM